MFHFIRLYSVLLHTLINEWQNYKHSKYLVSGTGGARKENSSHHRVIVSNDLNSFKMFLTYNFYDCSAKVIKIFEEGKIVEYILVSFVVVS